MKCHYTHPKGEEKVLIPGCWNVSLSGNIEDCTCLEDPHLAYIELLKSEGKFEQAKEYRKIMNENR